MIKARVIPALLLKDEGLVKTRKFNRPQYIGDPINTVRIFNELEVDELIFLDIGASPQARSPDLKILREIANECFMPLGYGGGLFNFEVVKSIFDIGFEKVVLNTVLHTNPHFISEIAEHYGNQAIVAAIDVKKNFWGHYEVWTLSGKNNTKKNPVEWAAELEQNGAGEILLTSIDREGTWEGFDINLTRKISDAVNVPVIAHGGCGKISHIKQVVEDGHAAAVALGSMVVYQQRNMGVLVNFPDKQHLESILK
ncbi:AglZ/HisF2 family acetamidino modification protein [Daejeonella sp. JGW-45]|uniref:AglZ/HisF2 family acetamidino modification protein n=1 Tax=Daejeonella sp. JGW-45 TaxID=3034148 RepID=UPI0023EA99E6|nr:AglZ/HisF2 family acetamidino modification protein [Daejeonella sp. JGW-45]